MNNMVLKPQDWLLQKKLKEIYLHFCSFDGYITTGTGISNTPNVTI